MSLRWIAARYAWIIFLREAVRAALRSPRWSREETIGGVVALGLAVGIPVLVPSAVWILTGRRILPFWFRPWVALVDPFGRIPHPLLTARAASGRPDTVDN